MSFESWNNQEIPSEQNYYQKFKKLINTISLSIFLTLSPVANSDNTQNQESKTIQFVHKDIETWEITKLTDYRWKWVIVNFWAPWCPICVQEFPELIKMDKKDNIVVISVAMDYWASKSWANEVIRRNNLNFEKIIYWWTRRDENSFSRQVWPVDFYPTTFLYDPNWEITAYMPWRLNPKRVYEFIEKSDKKNKSSK